MCPATSLLLSSIYSTFIRLEILEVHFDCAVGWQGSSSRLRSRCGSVRIFDLGEHFSWQAQEELCVFVIFVTAVVMSAQVPGATNA